MLLRTVLSKKLISFRTYARSSLIRVPQEIFENVFTEKVEQIKWESLRNDILKSDFSINNINIDGIIISKCFSGARLDIALSYINFLKSKSLEVNDVSASKIIRLYYQHFKDKKDQFTDEDQNEIKKWCRMITEKHDLIDPSTAENIIHGISLTDEWKTSLKLFDQIGWLGRDPSESAYSCVISKAINEDCDDTVWNLLNEISKRKMIPRTYVFLHWFQKYHDNATKIESMLEYISENNFILPEYDIYNFSDSLKRTFNSSLTTINRNGKCPSCSKKLPGVKLLQTEFDKLASSFLEDIFIRNDVFLKTNPNEIERFKKLIDSTVPFDAVIDGLNVAYSQGDKLSPKVYARILAQVVKYFADSKQKCLVIGRQHMRSWPKKDMTYIRQNSILFLTEDLSNDDLFLIYAALKSGPKTNIFSRDLMRQHSHLLTEKLKRLFRRWQQEHQFQLISVKNQHKIIVKEPILFELRAHKVNSIWHLPFTSENIYSSFQTFSLPTSWLCLKPK